MQQYILNNLGGGSPAGGTYTGPGVTNNGNGINFTFNPAAAGGPGTYTVTYTLNGLSSTASITVAPVVVVTTTSTPSTGTPNNGTATVSATGGAGGYTYFWSNGATSAVITGLAAGTYTVTVTDANGCTQSTTVTVQQQATIPGDACANANNINSLLGTTIGVPVVTAPYDNTGANATGDPSVDLAACFFQSDPLQHTLWYNFTGNGNRYRIRTVQGAATNYIQSGDTQAALFSGACTSPVFVSCNDDEDANNNVFNVSFEVNTVVGQEYRLLLDGYGGSQGQFCLEVTRIGNVSATDISNTHISMVPNPTTGIIQLSNVTADEIQVFDAMGRMVQHLKHPGNTIDLTGQPVGFYFLQIVEKGKLYAAQVVKQ